MPTTPPSRLPPPLDPDRAALLVGVKQALSALPGQFHSEITISGILATDIFSLNSTLGATIEEQTVAALNNLRNVWDPSGRFPLHRFVRQSQTFPDVRLQRISEDGPPEIILGLELKGWYLLAKEGEPSFRFVATPAACHEMDLLVIVPWALSNVISGSARLFNPYVEQARYAAEYRNHHWTELRERRGNEPVVINVPQDAAPYPSKADQIADRALDDGGGNFGRFARTGLMQHYTQLLDQEPLAGIPIKYWRDFLRAFSEGGDQQEIQRRIERLANQIIERRLPEVLREDVETIRGLLARIAESLG